MQIKLENEKPSRKQRLVFSDNCISLFYCLGFKSTCWKGQFRYEQAVECTISLGKISPISSNIIFSWTHFASFSINTEIVSYTTRLLIYGKWRNYCIKLCRILMVELLKYCLPMLLCVVKCLFNCCAHLICRRMYSAQTIFSTNPPKMHTEPTCLHIIHIP